MPSSNLTVGKIGENAAAEFLQKKGYRILKTHVTFHWGELDIVAQKGDKVVFVEVKTRTSDLKGKPFEAVNRVKIAHLMRSIELYILKNKLSRYKLSLDAVSVMLGSDNQVTEIVHYENINN